MRIERWWLSLKLRLRALFGGRQVDRELDEELQFHLEHKIDEGIARGLSPTEARRVALCAMGGVEQRKEEMRDTRRLHWLTDFADDLRYAIRGLIRTPGLTAFVVIALALGIGMTAMPFSMLDGLIFRPYPVPHPAGVVTLVSTSHDNPLERLSYREYLDIRDHTSSYEGVVASTTTSGVGFSAAPGLASHVAAGMMVSGNYFRVLDVEPQLGRSFRDSEDTVAGRDAVVVLGRDFWKREFASDPSVIGRTVRLNGTDFIVIGVAPEAFPGMQVFTQPDFYMPLAMARTFAANQQKDLLVDRDDRELSVLARIKAGTTLRQANNELAGLSAGFEREYPQFNRGRGAAVHTQFDMRTRGDDPNWKFGVMATILALTVLLVACTNVAGLLLSRARARRREIAIRLSLGAGRFRLIRLLLTESVVLALLGGLGGIAVGYAGIRFFMALSIPAELPVSVPFRMDGRVMLMSLVLAILSAIVCGLVPALQSTRVDLVNGLKSADIDRPGRMRLRGRNALVVAQIAMSLMLLAASFLVVRGFDRDLRAGMGFPKDHLLMVRFDPRLVQYDAAETEQFYKRLVDRAREAPGVERVALSKSPPLGLSGFDNIAFVPDGFQMPRDRENFKSLSDTVDEDFFATMGVPLLRGRGFRLSDAADAPRVAIVNELFARHYWPNTDAVGKYLRLENSTGVPVRIVGVAATVKVTTGKAVDFVYLPLAQRPAPRMVLLLRSSGDPLQLVASVKDIVRSLDVNMPMSETRTFEDLYRYTIVEGPGVAERLISIMATVGLVLAIAGLYGLTAYNASRRTREIGIRIAIGASPFDVLRLMMGKGLTLVGMGAVAGSVMAFGVERAINTMLFDAGGVDFTVYLVVVPAMVLVTVLAAYVPARRASRIAPTLALRCE